MCFIHSFIPTKHFFFLEAPEKLLQLFDMQFHPHSMVHIGAISGLPDYIHIGKLFPHPSAVSRHLKQIRKKQQIVRHMQLNTLMEGLEEGSIGWSKLDF